MKDKSTLQNERTSLVARLIENNNTRVAYIRAKLSVNLSSQVRALRKKYFRTQAELAQAADMKQSRISDMERPGVVNFNIETLIRLAAAFKVGLLIKFVPYSEMARWSNNFVQDTFEATQIENDTAFLTPHVQASAPEETPATFGALLGEPKLPRRNEPTNAIEAANTSTAYSPWGTAHEKGIMAGVGS